MKLKRSLCLISLFFLLGQFPAAQAELVLATHAPTATQFTDGDLQADLANRPPDTAKRLREQDLASRERLVIDLLTRRLIAQKARNIGLDKSHPIEARVKSATEQVLYDALMEQAEQGKIVDAELEALALTDYRAFPEKFTSQEEIRASHILITAPTFDYEAARVAASVILDRLKAGEPFERLAAAYSKDPGTAKKGGDLGFFPRGKMVPEFEKVAFNLKESGELSAIVQTSFGFHIIRLDERRPTALKPFSEVREGLMNNHRTRMRTEIRQGVIQSVREPETIKTQTEAIRSLSLSN